MRPGPPRATWEAFDRLTRGHVHAIRTVGRTPPDLAIYSVYRSANAGRLAGVLRDVPASATIRLHALDTSAPSLEKWTAAEGPGPRMPLLSNLISGSPPAKDAWAVLLDDDITFTSGGLARFVALARAGGLDLAMPAHAPGSNWTFRVTCRRTASTARLTRFVEIGPVLAISPRAMKHVYPFPPSARMGWGLDVRWSALSREGLLLGVVDATPVLHAGAVGASYGREYEDLELAAACRDERISSAYEIARDVGPPWRPWQRRPHWSPGGDS